MSFAASLRARLILILVLVNAVVLGALALWSAGNEQEQELLRARRLRQLQELVQERLSRYDQAGDLAAMLTWPAWREFEDVLIIDNRLVRTEDGRVIPVGAYWNPLGSRRRPADFPYPEIQQALAQAVARSEAVPVAAGLAVPLILGAAGQEGERRIVGGAYLRPSELPAQPFSRSVLVAAALITLVGGSLIYLFLGAALVRPVEELRRAAQDYGQGRRPALPAPGRAAGTEIVELVESTRSMMERIDGFQGKLRREVEEATAQAREAERRAARHERLAAIGTLAAGLAHEINSPLAGAMQGLETLRSEARGELARRHGQLTGEALERIAALVQRLLQLAPARAEPGECVIQQVIADLPEFLASRLRRHRLVVDVPAEPLRVRGAASDLFPVLLNLVQNSLDALDDCGRPGRVVVSARPLSAAAARIVVQDDGPGAPAELLPHLFEPFVTTKEVGKGTGLGLALAHATIRQLGGELEAANLPGGGFEARITLPRPAAAAD